MAFDKVAIDSFAKAYWIKLYGEYGKMFVRDIPRKIKRAAALELAPGQKTASDEFDASGSVVPCGHAILDNGGIAIEGVFEHDTIGKFAFQTRFNENGEVTSFDSIKLTAGGLDAPKPKADGTHEVHPKDLPDTKLIDGHKNTTPSKSPSKQ